MRYIGDIYRPPSEAGSLIVQCTVGCSHNACAFCIMYREKRFAIRPLDDVLFDLSEARSRCSFIQRIFLADGDALVLPQEYLLAVLDHIARYFPECTRVAAYASAKALRTKTDEQLCELKKRGLAIVYIGLETGLERLLLQYNKGATAEEIVAQSLRARQAGMLLSVTAISGMGGLALSREHAEATAAALSRIKAHYAALLTLRIYEGTPLYEWVKAGDFTPLSAPQLAAETRIILEKIDSEGTVFRSNHASNYLPLAGTLNADREKLLSQIDAALRGDLAFRKEYQLGL